jgi:hypothetical protein
MLASVRDKRKRLPDGQSTESLSAATDSCGRRSDPPVIDKLTAN